MFRYKTVFVVLIMGLLVSFIGGGLWLFHDPQSTGSRPLLIFAASSMTDVVNQWSDTYSTRYDLAIQHQFAGSSTLATQLQYGASADLFISADYAQIERLIVNDLIVTDDMSVVANNYVIVIRSLESPHTFHDLITLAKSDATLVLGARSVPIREYTEQILTQLEQTQPDTVARLRQQVVSEETNVRQILTRVALGQADAGFVYASDVRGTWAEQVEIIQLEPALLPQVTIYAAPLVGAHPATQDFVSYMLSAEGQAVLIASGFCPVVTQDAATSCP